LNNAVATARQHGVEAETVLVESVSGPTAALITTHAKEWAADLIVMGTHGRRGLQRLTMGSDAECAVRNTPVPVLLVHGISKEAITTTKLRAPDDASKQVVYA
jgi:nucleotide-binding universal stress UspA family protein